jgi:hypothetical protein
MISPDYEHIGVGFAEADDFSFYVMMVGWVGAKGSSDDTQDQQIPGVDDTGDPSGDSSVVIDPFILSEPDESGAIYHEVQPGQAAWTIAAQYGIELAELFERNQLTENAILHPGDLLMIRPPNPPTRTPTISSTSIPPTDLPIKSPTTLQATDVPVESVTGGSLDAQDDELVTGESITETDQNQGEVSARSSGFSVSLAVATGLLLLASVIIVFRFVNRKQ